jgi:hypothetical protein
MAQVIIRPTSAALTKRRRVNSQSNERHIEYYIRQLVSHMTGPPVPHFSRHFVHPHTLFLIGQASEVKTLHVTWKVIKGPCDPAHWLVIHAADQGS